MRTFVPTIGDGPPTPAEPYYQQSPESYVPPIHSEEWWQVYQEPLDMILTEMMYLDITVRALLERQPGTVDLPGASREKEANRLQAFEHINSELRRVGEQVTADPSTVPPGCTDRTAGKLRRQQDAGSLLAMMYLMLARDLTEPARVVPCGFEGCDNLVIRRKKNQNYCSGTCQNAATRRRQRAGGES